MMLSKGAILYDGGGGEFVCLCVYLCMCVSLYTKKLFPHLTYDLVNIFIEPHMQTYFFGENQTQSFCYRKSSTTPFKIELRLPYTK